MNTNKMSTGVRGTAPQTPFVPTGTDKDAAAWADLLDDWLGPDSDVYSRLLRRSEPNKKAKLSS